MSSGTLQPPALSEAKTLGSSGEWLARNGVYLAVVVLVVFNLIFTSNFLSATNFRTQLLQAAPVVIVALGMALVIGTEGVDLSVGAVMALAGAMIPLYLGYGVIAAIAVALLVGLLAGMFNGFLVAYVGVQPIVATLAFLVGGRGLALVISHGELTDVDNSTMDALGGNNLLGIPITVLIAAGLAVLIGVMVQRSTFGRRLVAVGGNRNASALAGLPVRKVLFGVYAISGLLAGVTGVLATARLGASDPTHTGLLMELSAITAVVVGGTPLTGGRVRILGTVMGAILMQLVRATLIKHNLPDSSTQMVQAVIIVIAVYSARERSTR
jgi:ribose/xylose/arabinose/galactoside ABC-type transport system permease subunit